MLAVRGNVECGIRPLWPALEVDGGQLETESRIAI